MKNVRVWFKKTGSVKYISHLDLTKCMSRALKLSGLPIWYTEGFNPRIYMTFAMPLSLGVSGERECMDIRFVEDFPLEEVVQRLNDHLPSDIEIFHVAEPEMKFDAIAYADYEMRLESDNIVELKEKLEEMLSQTQIMVMKHSKKGDKELDIKPYFLELKAEEQDDNHLKLNLRLPCSVSGSINPNLLLDALKAYQGEAPFAEVTRKRLLTEDFSEIK